MNQKFICLVMIAGLLAACKSDDDDQPDLPAPSSEYILIGNEGGFTAGNASLTLYDLESSAVTQNVYSAANNGAALGDVLHSMVHRNNEIYLVVNNSQKIVVVDDHTFAKKRSITGLPSPRYICFEEDNKAYVSNMAHNYIEVINPVAGTLEGQIPTTNYIEQMAIYQGELWCAAPESSRLYFIDLASGQLSDSLELSPGVTEIARDANNNFWVYTAGIWNQPDTYPAIYCVDGENKTILKSFPFEPSTGYFGTMRMSADGQNVLYLAGGKLFKMPIDAEALPQAPFISPDEEQSFYGLSVNPADGEIGLTNALDFSQNGYVRFYNAAGQQIDQVEAGLIPRSVLWMD